MLSNLLKEIEENKDEEKAKLLQGFFKTGKGQYGEWDVFYGLMMPKQRKLVKKYYNKLNFLDIETMLQSPVHEIRNIWLLILVEKFKDKKISEKEKKDIFSFYMSHTKAINNWDLVDLTAPYIVWLSLLDGDRSVLFDLVRSDSLWERRIAVLATFAFIRNRDFDDILKLASMLLDDKHDLMHKAVWWMLREVGKKDEKTLTVFLDKYTTRMPRTMLRYSIERLDKTKKEYYMKLR